MTVLEHAIPVTKILRKVDDRENINKKNQFFKRSQAEAIKSGSLFK